MAAPQTITVQRFGYTATDATTTGVQPGRWEWSRRSRAPRTFIAFESGNGPSGGSFVARVLANGITIMTMTALTGTEERTQDLSPFVDIFEGDLIAFSIITVSGASGVVTFGFDYF